MQRVVGNIEVVLGDKVSATTPYREVASYNVIFTHSDKVRIQLLTTIIELSKRCRLQVICPLLSPQSKCKQSMIRLSKCKGILLAMCECVRVHARACVTGKAD